MQTLRIKQSLINIYQKPFSNNKISTDTSFIWNQNSYYKIQYTIKYTHAYRVKRRRET